MTRAQYILWWLGKYHKGTCQQITAGVIRRFRLTGNKAKYASGSVSSLLVKFVKNGLVTIAETEKGPKGGNVYIQKIYNPSDYESTTAMS